MSLESSISTEAYRNKALHPTPTPDQNLSWYTSMQAGHEAEWQLAEWQDEAGKTLPLGMPICRSMLDVTVKAGHYARQSMIQGNLLLVDHFIDPTKPPFSGYQKKTHGLVLALRRFVAEALEFYPTIELDDVRQWGRIGLIEAVDHWEPHRAPLEAAVYPAVSKHVRRGFMNEGQTIRIKSVGVIGPHDQLSDRRNLAFIHNLEGGYSDELADMTSHPDYWQTTTVPYGWQTDSVTPALTDCPSTDRSGGVDLTDEPIDASWSDTAGMTYNHSPEHIKDILATLDERNQEIVKRRYGFHDGKPKFFREIAPVVELTPQGVAKRISKILRLIGSQL